jgi:hypothetical protein
MDALSKQSELDLAFADLDYLLDRRTDGLILTDNNCRNCGGNIFTFASTGSSMVGSRTCDTCAVVEDGPVFFETMYGLQCPRKSSNYKRVHHWHERISQLLILESQIPDKEMLQIAERLCDGSFTFINKDIIRSVLRSLNLQNYIEKWLQIIQRITGISPPRPGISLVQELDRLFLELQRPFDAHKTPDRKNFLNYNYVFCRLLQKLGCKQFCMFFPLIKSNQKLQQLDEMWAKMAKSINWQSPPLEQVPPFCVRLCEPSRLLERLQQFLASRVVVEHALQPIRIVFRTSGQVRFVGRYPKLTMQHQSELPALPIQKRSLGRMRRR